MAYSVVNGAVGKSPLIDKLNQLPSAQTDSRVSRQMEEFVMGDKSLIYQPVPVTFEKCKEEIRTQLKAQKGEG